MERLLVGTTYALHQFQPADNLEFRFSHARRSDPMLWRARPHLPDKGRGFSDHGHCFPKVYPEIANTSHIDVAAKPRTT